ncbi:hypothetical protein M8C21_023669 [Ambrosia artemisiifolia]|uniref:RING-type E3 ubiquitin transferase n=1 Tax=Ambrosia artemisiifolia TaxID=4212 RepID=A0AAD5GQ99_AMBAR|nr:hypothetical protein M8C21_023669 [Ambrosia artemisiifolia]
MEDDGIIEGVDELATPSSLVVALAVNGSRKTKYVVRWALDKFVPEGMLLFKLFFIRPKITRIPTPMGSVVISQVRDDVVNAYRKEVEWQTYEKLLPFKNMCDRRKVDVEIVQIESDDVVDAIKHEIVKNNISKLVIGASSKGIFSRGKNLSSRISESIPSFCTVYAISKGKLSSLRASDSETIGSSKDESNSSDSSSITNSSSLATSSRTEWTDQGSATSYSQFFSNSLPTTRIEALSSINRALHKETSFSESSRNKFLDSGEGDETTVSYAGNPDYFHANSTDNNINFEIEKLRVELRHFRGMYAIAQNETFDASRRLNDLEKQQLEESIRLKELKVKEEEAKYLAQKEKEQHEAAKRQAEYVKENLRRESAIRKGAEERALQESREKEKLLNAITGASLHYQKFTWEEIVAACSSFSEDLKIGTGGNGTVYKSNFHHTIAAVKVLHSQEAHRTKQFQQEPKSIIHRDLKPANILLDQNLVSKIGDVGLSTMLQSDLSSTTTIYKDTSPAGTLCYIDPEYQRTGLVSPKSDVYALGILLTARPAIAVTHVVETALEDDELANVLDPEAGEWPINETKELAILALSCAELKRKDRPDLKDTVLPVLERLKAVADAAQRTTSKTQINIPNHFRCPLLKEVMGDPCVAADGYTYERMAIEKWFKENDSSPMTNLPFTSRSLTPNYTLLSAILEWKSRT